MSQASNLEGALSALPLFPLPRVVLFPGCILPLHIFEPRYQAMLADSLATHRCIGMVLVAERRSDSDLLPIAPVAGLGVIVAHESLADGRSNIVLQGRARVALDELPFVPPYRRGRARILQECATSVSTVERAALQASATLFAARISGAEVSPELHIPSDIEPGGLADLCAFHMVLDPHARQRALEELDVAKRVRLVTGELVAQTASHPTKAREALN